MSIRAVPLLLDKNIEIDFLYNLIEKYHPAYIWCKEEFRGKLEGSILDRQGQHILLRTDFDLYEINEELAMLLSTSGSTGSQKFVRISYNNLEKNTGHAVKHLHVLPWHRGITALPLNFAGGLTFCHWHWYVGATVLITEESVISQKFRELFIKEKANNMLGVPYTFEIMKKVKFFETLPDIGQLEVISIGGGKLSQEFQMELSHLLKDKFYLTYGLTECTCVVLILEYPETAQRKGCVGKPLGDMHITLKNENNQIGELVVQNETVCMGYALGWGDLIKGDENHGIWETGDIARQDEDGCIYIIGREKRFIKVLGKRISLDEIESILKAKYTQYDLACIGEDNKLIVCCVNICEEVMLEMSKFVSEKIHVNRRMIQIKQLHKEIPRNKSGKIQYETLECLCQTR